MDAMKSLDGRTTWEMNTETGELTETGGDCLQFKINPVDVEIILELLRRNEAIIHKGADRTRSKLYGRAFKSV